MKRVTAVQDKNETTSLPIRGPLEHSAVRAAPEHERPSHAPLESRFGHDFSQASVRPAAPMVGQNYATSACPVFPRTCPFGGACHVCPPKVQTKLKVNRPGDKYEHEADRVVGQVMRSPERGAAQARKDSGYAQVPHVKVQRGATGQSAPATVPPIVNEVLCSPGRPLDPVTRAFTEPRFGHDFSRVRLHSDVKAAESARAVNALAYTVGHHIVFGAGQYAPRSAIDRQLIAHELVHTIQQSDDGVMLQRYVTCESREDCPRRVSSGEVRRSRTDPMLVGSVSNSITGLLVANFAIGGVSTKPDLSTNPTWRNHLRNMAARPNIRWEILGFTDCHGTDDVNRRIRAGRANAVSRALPPQARRQVDTVSAAPLTDCMAENTDEQGRAYNRSAFIRLRSTEITFPKEEITVTPPNFICGPDVTAETALAVSGLRSAFAGLSTTQKEEVCDTLDSHPEGTYTWDIIDLYNNAWIHRNYRPACATAGATPPCGESVQVGSECYYAGSANYVIFGVMCKLCFDHFASIPDISGAYRFRERAMLNLINLYKGTGPFGLSRPGRNFRESQQWASAGYHGWPSGGTPPPGDRSNCEPMCPLPYTGPSFRVRWCPHLDPASQCPSR